MSLSQIVHRSILGFIVFQNMLVLLSGKWTKVQNISGSLKLFSVLRELFIHLWQGTNHLPGDQLAADNVRYQSTYFSVRFVSGMGPIIPVTINEQRIIIAYPKDIKQEINRKDTHRSCCFQKIKTSRGERWQHKLLGNFDGDGGDNDVVIIIIIITLKSLLSSWRQFKKMEEILFLNPLDIFNRIKIYSYTNI